MTERLGVPNPKPDTAFFAALENYNSEVGLVLGAMRLQQRMIDRIPLGSIVTSAAQTDLKATIPTVVADALYRTDTKASDKDKATIAKPIEGAEWIVEQFAKIRADEATAFENLTTAHTVADADATVMANTPLKKSIDDAYDAAQTTQKAITKLTAPKDDGTASDYDKAGSAAAATLQAIESETFTATQQIPTIPTGDQLKYSLDVTPKPETKGGDPEAKDDNFVALNVVDQWRINFSSGIFFHNLVEPSYHIVSVPDPNHAGQTINRIVRGPQDSFQTAVGALTHVYYKTGHWLQPALSLGVSVDAKTQQARYFLGGSLILGEARRAILTFGMALGQVSRLANGEMLAPATTTLTKDTDIVTKSVFRPGLFAGISYNFN